MPSSCTASTISPFSLLSTTRGTVCNLTPPSLHSQGNGLWKWKTPYCPPLVYNDSHQFPRFSQRCLGTALLGNIRADLETFYVQSVYFNTKVQSSLLRENSGARVQVLTPTIIFPGNSSMFYKHSAYYVRTLSTLPVPRVQIQNTKKTSCEAERSYLSECLLFMKR